MPENQDGQAPGDPQAPAKPDLMGYDSVESLVAAKRSSDQEAKRLYDQNKQYETYLANLAQTQKPQPTAYDQLAEYGIPREAMREAIQTEARSLLREELAPLVAAGTARESILGEYPDFQKHEPQLQRFLKENPEVNEQYQWAINNARQNPNQAKMAMEWAYLKYGDKARGQSRPAEGSPDPSQAALPSNSAQDRSPQTGADAEALKKTQEYGKKYGDWRPFAHERLKGIIPDSHFGG